MFFPEQLYQLSARDLQVSWLDPSYQRATNAAGGASMSLVWGNIPAGQIFLMQSLVLRLNHVPPITLLDGWIGVRDLGPLVTILSGLEAPGGATKAQNYVTWSGSLVVPPGWRFEAAATFSGAIGNIIEGFAAGILIPVANVQRV